MDAFFEEKWALDPQFTVKEALSQQVAVIGENLNIRRFEKYEKTQAGKLVSYIHGGGRIGVLIELACENEAEELVELGKNIAMQIAALNPKFITENDVPADFIAKETEILTVQAKNDPKNAKKPDNIIEKMIAGRLKKELKEFCLVEQPYVKDTDMTVKQYIDSVAKVVGCLLYTSSSGAFRQRRSRLACGTLCNSAVCNSGREADGGSAPFQRGRPTERLDY